MFVRDVLPTAFFCVNDATALGVIISLNALVIALGFVIPWLAVAGLIVLVVWLIRRARRRRREPKAASEG